MLPKAVLVKMVLVKTVLVKRVLLVKTIEVPQNFAPPPVSSGVVHEGRRVTDRTLWNRYPLIL